MDNENSIGRWVSILYRLGQSYLDRKLKEIDLSCGQFPFLMLLFKKDGVSQDSLAKSLCIDKGTTARAVKKLEASGYVKRVECFEDKRINKVILTQKANEIEPQIELIISQWTELLTKDFELEEKEIALKLLKRMAGNVLDCNC
ncbi:DNA-binding transcriptional regulator, MarR family [Desulfonispora thiosulfatigenes DSM 11270]|uniref:DNA-binding transcriptional regulator, MarR family n=1 Tax=Desulfonispora thiosulfatigenes DSM 11270 TaxID=656914 RepID=A0A1W1UEM6_DESTI|nr:MarR family transcriptional regulator [Desulfonispora thiosulfatigenes]SMB79499.1 DNA-binding transcriptional regulator, MarR family [Desulfonispora thiosulfatigenes DSM 11270]